MNLRRFEIKKSFCFSLQCNFSIYSNSRHKMRYVLGNKEYKLDMNVHLYDPYTQAYLYKRWTKKSEIEPKIYIIKPLKNIIDSLQTQKLVNLRTLLDERRLNDFCLHESIDTKYIMSICCEPYFKPMLDQYLSKVLVNGMVVPMKNLETYEKIKRKVVNLYKVFFFGDPISLYEREIEKKYLAMKQDKWHKFMFKNLPIHTCQWTYNEQKCLEGIRNWRTRNILLYDDFRPFYDDFPEAQQNDILNNRPKQENLTFIASVLLSRTNNYCISSELISLLEIPPDFHLETCFLNFHLALLISRIRSLNNLPLCISLEKEFDKLINHKAIKLSFGNKKMNVFQSIKFLKIVREIIIECTKASVFNKEKLYYVIKLLEKLVFLQRKENSKNQLKLWALYFIENYSYLNTLDLKRLITIHEWDIYKVFPEDLKLVPKEISEFNDQFDHNFKKLYAFENEKPYFDFSWIIKKIRKIPLKFFTLETYDYFNEREELEKNIKKHEAKYFWKSSKNQQIKKIE